MPKRTQIRKKVVIAIIKEISRKMKIANNKVFKPYEIELSSKNLSELVGKVAESTFAKMLTKELGYDVINAKSDRDPDLRFTKTGESFEIKVSSSDNSWQGGEFSTRPYDYFFISWGGDFDEFFVARAILGTNAWRSNIKKRRYGTTYYAKDLLGNKTKQVYIGEIYKTPRGAIKVRKVKL